MALDLAWRKDFCVERAEICSRSRTLIYKLQQVCVNLQKTDFNREQASVRKHPRSDLLFLLCILRDLGSQHVLLLRLSFEHLGATSDLSFQSAPLLARALPSLGAEQGAASREAMQPPSSVSFGNSTCGVVRSDFFRLCLLIDLGSRAYQSQENHSLPGSMRLG